MSNWQAPHGYEGRAVPPPEYKVEKVEELTEGLRENVLEQEAREKIAKIDMKLRDLALIENSQLAPRDGERAHEELSETISANEAKLVDDLVEGQDTAELETTLREQRVRKEESDELYEGDAVAYMVNQHPSSYRYGQDKIKNRTFEEMDESTQALIKTLEDTGLTREEIMDNFNGAGRSFTKNTEEAKLREVINLQKRRLEKERNQERLAVPNELQHMVAELVKKNGFIKKDVDELVEYVGSKSDGVSVKELHEALGINWRAMDLYPDEAQRGFYEKVANDMSKAERAAIENPSSLAADLDMYDKFSTERFRPLQDIERDFQTYEQAMEFIRQEEAYLEETIRAGKQFKLVTEAVSDSFNRYSEKYTNDDSILEWPAEPHELQERMEKIRDRGGFTLSEFDFAGVYRNALLETASKLAEKHGGGKRISPFEIAGALQEAKAQVEAKLDEYETEREQHMMHTAQLNKLAATKHVIRR